MEESPGTHYGDTEAQESRKPTTEAQRHGEKQMPAEDQNIKTLPLMTLIALIVTDGKLEELTTGTRRRKNRENLAKRHGDTEKGQMPAEDQKTRTMTRRFAMAIGRWHFYSFSAVGCFG